MRDIDTQIRGLLSPATRKEIMSLVGPRPLRYIFEVAVTWALIVGSIGIALRANNPLVSAVAILFIATRQNILGLLIHEQTHKLGFRSKYGDWFANAVAGYPLIVLSVENYSRVHLSHHYYYFTRDDPDFIRKNGRDWVFPMTGMHLLVLFCRDISGLTLLQNIRGKNVKITDKVVIRPHPAPIGFKIIYFVVAAGLLTYFDLWLIFLMYWILPLVTVLQVLIRWGALCEHSYGEENSKVEDSSPTIILRWWEKLLVPNLNFTLHPYHHYFPSISFSKLPDVHRIFVREGLVKKEAVFDGYFSYLKHLLHHPVEAGLEVHNAAE